jgi:hypothetical protein
MNKMCIPQVLKSALLVLSICLTCIGLIKAQYHYQDIVSAKQIGQTFLQYKKNRINRVNVSAFDRNVALTNAVVIQQTVNTRENTLVTYTKTPDSDESWLKTRYSNEGQLIYTSDSTEEMVTRTNYSYNNASQLTEISNISIPKNNPTTTETHRWFYNSQGYPEKMLKIKSGNDTIEVSFILDEKNNVSEEKSTKKGSFISRHYYYYNEQNQLTDIARYNRKADKILPDYMFEYNEQQQLLKMIVVPEGMAGNYQTWKYEYNAEGLKTKELCFNKQKQLVGRVEYSYQTGN